MEELTDKEAVFAAVDGHLLEPEIFEALAVIEDDYLRDVAIGLMRVAYMKGRVDVWNGVELGVDPGVVGL